MKRLSVLPIAIFLITSTCAQFANTATVTGTLGINAVVGVGCQVNSDATSGSVNFGTLSFGNVFAIGSQNIDSQTSGVGNGGILVECSSGTKLSITLDNGQHFSNGTRSMVNTTDNSVLLNYSLYQNPARTIPWTTSSPLTATSTGVADTYEVYGRIWQA